jgi:putative membrane protein
MDISPQDHARIASAIRSAEAKASGEIVCVLARTSSHATALPVLIAAAVALALPWLLMDLTAMTVHRILLLQVVVFLALLVLLCLPRVRVALMPRKARRAIAHRVAMEQFVSRGIARTKDRSGILIFVSLAERYARIIADEGIAARVPQAEWQAAIDALVAHMRDGRIADAFITAIDLCGNKLAEHFPRTAAGSEVLPDRIYLI